MARPRLAVALRGALVRIGQDAADVAVRVYHKAGEDDIFFLAGAIAFNFLLGAIPFLLLLLALAGYVLPRVTPDPERAVVEYLLEHLVVSKAAAEFVRGEVVELLRRRSQVGAIGLVLLVWVSTRMVGCLRSTLREVFDLVEERGIIAGKWFDMKMVVVAGTLFLANLAVTAIVEALSAYRLTLFGHLFDAPGRWLQTIGGQVLAFLFIFLMFVLIYRYLPLQRPSRRVVLVAASVAAVFWELLKGVFAWYVAHVATNVAALYGALGALVVFVFWIYYSAVVFILAGEIGWVLELQHVRRRQREWLVPPPAPSSWPRSSGA